ncbi:MAG TPA: MmcQ/YjbR family DNA-binding protein [Vicinamibacterales bacterium]|nr:MmcQ/YjbR family DNA-binding protein [Vicinamibacterales bacterium]
MPGYTVGAVARRKAITFETVREIALTLPGAEEGTAYGTPVLRVNGHIFAGIPINKEVEPNSLGIWLTDVDERDALIEEEPETYYVKPHYQSYPIVLVRLGRVSREALEDLVVGAHRANARRPPAKRRPKKATVRKRR